MPPRRRMKKAAPPATTTTTTARSYVTSERRCRRPGFFGGAQRMAARASMDANLYSREPLAGYSRPSLSSEQPIGSYHRLLAARAEQIGSITKRRWPKKRKLNFASDNRQASQPAGFTKQTKAEGAVLVSPLAPAGAALGLAGKTGASLSPTTGNWQPALNRVQISLGRAGAQRKRL